MKYFATLPEITQNYSEGRTLLTKLENQARELTYTSRRMKREGVLNISLPKIVETYLSGHEESDPIDPGFFRFTGRKVIVSPEKFFSHYEKTPEGQEYARNMKALGNNIYGCFAYIHYN